MQNFIRLLILSGQSVGLYFSVSKPNGQLGQLSLDLNVLSRLSRCDCRQSKSLGIIGISQLPFVDITSGCVGLFVDPMISNIFSVVICLASGKAEIMTTNKEFR